VAETGRAVKFMVMAGRDCAQAVPDRQEAARLLPRLAGRADGRRRRGANRAHQPLAWRAALAGAAGAAAAPGWGLRSQGKAGSGCAAAAITDFSQRRWVGMGAAFLRGAGIRRFGQSCRRMRQGSGRPGGLLRHWR
jgi:hypothetical protein